MNELDKTDRLLQNNIVVDAHLDLLKDLLYQQKKGRRKVLETDYLEDFKQGGINVVVSSVFVDDLYLPEMALRHALDQISSLYRELEECGDSFALCRNGSEINAAIEGGKIAIILSFEGVEPLGQDLHLLQIFYELGVRLIGLTWSRLNYAADGSRFLQQKRGTEGGLTEFGVQIMGFAERKGMLIDISHINDRGFWDVISITSVPLIASHSNCRSLNDIPRNLSDEMIKAVAETGGVIGINAVSIIASVSDEKSHLGCLVDHMEHITALAGADHVGFGFDLCKKIDVTHEMAREPFDILNDYSDVGKLVDIMITRGFTESEIIKICGGNFMRLFSQVLSGKRSGRGLA